VRTAGAAGPLQQRRQYWVQTRRLTAALLLFWFVVSFVLTFFARELRFALFGWPFSYYMAAQGALLCYLLIVWIYSRQQERRDAAFGIRDAGNE
jgi:putative solute:sodium symporter small subunit